MEFKVTFTLALMLLQAIDTGTADLPKASYARTMLKVSRSLPGETEELKVRTSEGNMATLIVKRRDRTIADPSKPVESSSASSVQDSSVIESRANGSRDADGTQVTKAEPISKEEIRRSEDAQVEQLRAELSGTESKMSDARVGNASRIERPDSTEEKDGAVSERNIDYGNWTPLGTDGRAVRIQESSTEEYQSWKPLRGDPKTSTVVDDEEGEEEKERTNYARFDPVFPGSGLLLPRHFQDRSQRKLQLAGQRGEEKTRYTFLSPHQIRPSRTNIGANLSKNRDAKNVPAEVIVRSEINVKSSAKRSPMTLDKDGTPVIHGTRVPDEPIDKIQTWRNARVINNKLIRDGASPESGEVNFYSGENSVERQRFERFFENVNRSPIPRYAKSYEEEGRNVYFEWDPKNYKNEALKAEIYESEPGYRDGSRKRMLHPDGISVYPVSQLYTPESQKIAPVALKPGARAPVLQYAHPELGVQPAKIVKNEKRRPDNFPENQYSFTEQRQKKKYVLNDKNIVDSYTSKNYYPNQHFYGLKRPSDAPFWVKISENLKSQFSNGVERVSQFTRPVIDPLVEATHKISQNLGLSKGKEAQDKVGTVASGGSILIPALGLVASGAALGIGAVAVGRYLDVDVLRRSNDGYLASELEYQRALDTGRTYQPEITEASGNEEPRNVESYDGQTVYFLQKDPRGQEAKKDQGSIAAPLSNEKGVLVLVETTGKGNDAAEMPKGSSEGINDSRRKRSLDYLDIFKAERNLKSLVRNKRLQRKGADSMSEIVEIDLPAREGSIEVTEFLIPKRKTSKKSSFKKAGKEPAILLVEDGPMPLGLLRKNLAADVSAKNSLDRRDVLVGNSMRERSSNGDDSNHVDGRDERRRRRRRSAQELQDALQNLENTEIAQVAHVDGDWASTPCAKRLFCDAMIRRGADAVIGMEKKMAALLSLIQPGAAVQVSSHFQEVMDAVRRHDCSSFLCPQARPGNVFF